MFLQIPTWAVDVAKVIMQTVAARDPVCGLAEALDSLPMLWG